MLYTSCYSRVKLLPPGIEPVAISAGVPRWWGKRRRELRLAPSRALLNAGLPLATFVRRFEAKLAKVDPIALGDELGPSACLYCWCQAGFQCHRRLVAERLERALGIEIPEMGFPRKLLLTFDDLPCKGASLDEFPWHAKCDHCKKNQPVPLGPRKVRCTRCRKNFSLEW